MSKDARIILVISVLFTLAMGLSNIFVNIILWKKSNDFVIVALYNLVQYFFTPLTFIFAGWLSKKKNGLWPLRLGILFFISFFGLILLIEDRILSYIYPLGILLGIASGFYWFAHHIISFDNTDEKNRDTFNGFNGCVVGGANAIAPLVGGYIIRSFGNSTGYTIIFAVSLFLFLILIFVSILLKDKNYKAKLDLSHLWGSRHHDWTRIRHSINVWGLRDVVIGFLIVILIYKSTGSELSVGKLTLLASVLSSLAFIIQQKLIKPRFRLLSMSIGASFMFIAVVGLTFNISFMTLLIFLILDAMFTPFFITPISSASYNIINEYHEENLRAEYIINKEIILNMGRIISTVILILLLLFIKKPFVLNVFLFVLGSTQFVSLFFLRKAEIWKVK